MKKIAAMLLCICLLGATLPAALAEETVPPAMSFRELTASEITKEMGIGWNLGNTMDGHTGFMPDETVWQPYVTTQKLITAVHDAGFNTMRVPVTWGLKIDDDNGYQIDDAWLSRVQEIVDYAVSQDMYVILNIHHDGAEQTGWLRIAYEGEQFEQVKEKFAAVWRQIAERFRDYDEHLIFEDMNEVCGDDPSEAGYLHDFRNIEALNQLFVDTVRATGGNNARRWLTVVPRYTNIDNVLNEKYGFTMPTDSCEPQHLMLTVHDYDYSFGIQATMGATYWSQEKALALAKKMEQLQAIYVDHDVPVLLDEYGAVYKKNDGNRAYYYEAMCRMASKCGIVPVAWDIGWYDDAQDPDYAFTHFYRATGEEREPGIINAMLRGYYLATSDDLRRNIIRLTKIEDPAKAPEQAAFESVSFPQKQIFMASGESQVIQAVGEPAATKGLLTYQTTNPEVVTVSNGLLQAKAPGSAKITASTRGGDAKAEMIVVVRASQAVEIPVTAIEAEDSVTMETGASLQLQISLAPADHTDSIYFTSADSRVVTVNGLGRLTAVGAGETTVTIAAASGAKKTVSVTVEASAAPEAGSEGVPIAIGIYYNDSVHNYYSTENSETLFIGGDGTYTMTFDAAKDLSEKAKEAGVADLTGVGAIYLYDITGTANVLSACSIHYDEILLDGEPVTLTEHAPKSAIKANGKFDTNDPLNAWDGSVTEGVTAENYNLIFAGNAAPASITITFTLTDWQYAGN